METIERKVKERAFLLGVGVGNVQEDDILDSLEELQHLATTAGAKVVGQDYQYTDKINPATYVKKGKLENLADTMKDLKVDILIFDEDLSPRQAANMEDITGVRTIDRSQLILDIFALRAQTREARLEVELAQLQYMLPRLVRYWQHLSRIRGGIGTRGPGETQLETDRRIVRQKISRLKKELKHIARGRITRAKERRKCFQIAIVGYTNAGKSTLMKLLTRHDSFIEDKLFATLDTTTRKARTITDENILVTDTVGFIRKLPTHLVASFASTLEEARSADLLMIILDASHHNISQHLKTVNETLSQMGLDGQDKLMVLNKLDLIPHEDFIDELLHHYPDANLISAKSGMGLSDLKDRIVSRYMKYADPWKIKIDATDHKHLEQLYRCSKVLDVKYEDDFVLFEVVLPERYKDEFGEFRLT